MLVFTRDFETRKEYDYGKVHHSKRHQIRAQRRAILSNARNRRAKGTQIGKYGLLHRDYLKHYKRGTYTTLLTEGRLNAHLHEIDVQANEMVEAIVANLAEATIFEYAFKLGMQIAIETLI